MEQVILVDESDNEVGIMEKMAAHKSGLLHRAFSVLIFNSKGEMLLQKRADKKYHSAGLWTNACCSHPSPGESIEAASRRRLNQEMGIDASSNFAFKFIYKVKLEGGLTEHELDHVMVGKFDGAPAINSNEVADWKYVDMQTLLTEVAYRPDQFSHWFRLILKHPDFVGAIPQT